MGYIAVPVEDPYKQLVVFIDAASFLEKGWDSISPYTRQIGPVDAFDSWFKTGSDPTPFAIEKYVRGIDRAAGNQKMRQDFHGAM